MTSRNPTNGNSPRHLKILHLASEYPPQEVFGLGRYVRDLAVAQAARGHEVHVVSNSMGGADHDLVEHGVHVHRVDFPPPPKPADSGAMVMQFNTQMLARVLKDRICLNADFVVAHDWLTAPVARLLARRSGGKFVVTVHDLVLGKTGGQLDNDSKFIGNHEHWYCGAADLLLCVSAATRDEAMARYGAPPERTFAIHNAVDPKAFPEVSAADLYDFRRALAPAERLIVLYVGRLDAEKGIDTLIAAFDVLIRRGVNAQLVIVGKGSLETSIRANIREFGLEERVTLTGYVGQPVLNHVLRAAAVHVVPSRYEPFGIVALEGMVCARPVVASAVGGLREIIVDGDSARLVPPDDVSALTAALAEILVSPDLARRLGVRARERVLADFSWSRVAERIDAILTGQVATEIPEVSFAAHPAPSAVSTLPRPRLMVVVQTHPPDFHLLEHNREAFSALARGGHHVRMLCLVGQGEVLQRAWQGIAQVIEADAEAGHEHLVRKTLDGYRRILAGNETWDWLVKLDSDTFIAGDILAYVRAHHDDSGSNPCEAFGKPSTFQPVIDAIHARTVPVLPINILMRTGGRYLRGFFYGIRRAALIKALPLLERVAPGLRVEDATVTACLLASGARLRFHDHLECYLGGRRDYDARSPVLNVGTRVPDDIARVAEVARERFRHAIGMVEVVTPKATNIDKEQAESDTKSMDSASHNPGLRVPRLTIVTQIRNRADYLLRMLQTAQPQWPDDESIEWIVIDYGGTDNLANALHQLPLAGLRYLYADQTGRFSSAHARNIGFQAARAPYILALDGDLLLPPGFLGAVVAAIAARPDAALFGPVYKLMPVMQNRLSDGELHGVRDFDMLLTAARPHVIAPPAGAILGAPRTALFAVGGYDEGFAGYGFQDIDLVQRLRHSGVAEQTLPDLFALHQFHGYPADYNTAAIEADNRQRFLAETGQVVRNAGVAWGRLPQGDLDLTRVAWLERVYSQSRGEADGNQRIPLCPQHEGPPLVWCDGVKIGDINAFLDSELREHDPGRPWRWVTSRSGQVTELKEWLAKRRSLDRVECHSTAQVTTQFARASRVLIFAVATHANDLHAAALELHAPVQVIPTVATTPMPSPSVASEGGVEPTAANLLGLESTIRTVLICMTEGLGNMIMLTPMLRALTDWLPEAEVHIHGKPSALQLLAGMPRIRPFADAKPPATFYDLVLVPGWGKNDVGIWSQVRSRHPFVIGGRVTVERHEAEQNLDLLRRLGWTGTAPAPYCARAEDRLPATTRRQVALLDATLSGTTWQKKRWPHYRELAARLLADGYAVHACGDTHDAVEYRELPWPPGVVNHQGTLGLLATASVMAQMNLVIANDCGLGHMAAALGVPTLALFGPTSIEKNRPLGEHVRVLTAGIHCSPCQGSGAWEACANWRCMQELRVEDVLAAAAEWLAAETTTVAELLTDGDLVSTHGIANATASVNTATAIDGVALTAASVPASNIAYWRTRYASNGGARTVGPSNWRETKRYEAENRSFADFVRPHLPHGGTVLDFGCGTGRWVPLLAQQADHYRGCDIVEEVIADLRRHHANDTRYHFMSYDGRNVPFDGETFDWIWSCVVLQHIVDDAALAGLAAQFHARLRRGGRIVLTENIAPQRSNHYLRFRPASDYLRLFSDLGLRQVAAWEFGIGEPHGVFIGEKA